jgi:hypothetical protein
MLHRLLRLLPHYCHLLLLRLQNFPRLLQLRLHRHCYDSVFCAFS